MARPGLTEHRKFRRLARALGSPILARGALELLWDSCYEAGDDYVGTAEDVEHVVGWTGEPGVLTRALAEAGAPVGGGFIEPLDPGDASRGYRVHDLWHHAPEYVAKRRRREEERRQKLEPVQSDRRTADTDRRLPTCQDGDGRPPSPSPSPVPEPSRVSPADVVGLWNAIVTAPIPKVTKLTPDRSLKINARLRSYPELPTWRTVIEWLNAQDWCRASGTGDHPNWTASLDWLCKSDGNIQKWLERASIAPRHVTAGPVALTPEEVERRRNTSKYATGGQR